MSVSGGSITVPSTFQDANDGRAVYLTPGGQGTGGDTGELRAVGANKCLDVPGLSTEPGTRVQIWDCHGGSTQQWTHG